MSELSIFASLVVFMTIGFVLGELFAMTGVFEDKHDFALFFFALLGFFMLDFMRIATGVNAIIPVGIIMWGALLAVFSHENGAADSYVRLRSYLAGDDCAARASAVYANGTE